MHLGRTVFVLDNVTTPPIGPGDVLVVESGSGGTPTLVSYAEGASRQGAAEVLLTISTRSQLAEIKDVAFRIPAATPKLAQGEQRATALPMGASFETALELLLELVTLQLMDETGVTSEQMFTRHANLE
jgi:6-phospho-3-hexuloisomerase